MKSPHVFRWVCNLQQPTTTYKLRATLPGCRSLAHHIRTSATDSNQNGPETLRYPDAPTNQHSDIPTYVAYAKRIGLDTSSKVFVGTYYEYTTSAALEKYGLQTRRVGRSNDYGIDLLGSWSVPSAPKPLRVLLQCKMTASIRPREIRELEGAFVGAPPGWRGPGVIGILVSQQGATKGLRESLRRSRWPMGFITCSSEGVVTQMLWNSRAEEDGLAGMGIGLRLSEAKAADQEIVLTWNGKPTSFGNNPNQE